jgi:hypothetical protein
MNTGYQWFAFAVGFFYGVVVGGVIAAKALGW